MPRACKFALISLLVWMGTFVPTQLAAQGLMVIAPHPDDEVLIAAGVIRRAIAAGTPVKVVVVTNGDIQGDVIGLTRQSESVASLALLGLAEEDIIFLGYGDASLYPILSHASATQVIVSSAGRSATYGNRGLGGVDYHTFIHGNPGPYNRESLQEDVRRVINTYQPAQIYLPGLHDRHPDHIGTYMLVVETITGLKRSGVAYSPMLFEGLVHAPCEVCSPTTLWPLPPFTPWAPFPKPVDLDSTPLTWSWIESFTVPAEMRDPDPAINLKARAIARHETQASDFLNAFVKSNEFFWRHDFSNLALTAVVTASAERAATGQTRDRAVDGLVSGEPSDPLRFYREWVAQDQTDGAWIRLTWPSARQVGQIRLFDRPNTTDNILSGTLTFSDGSTIAVGALPPQGAGLIISFPVRNTTSVTFQIDEAEGVNTGLAEIEVFGPSTPVPTNGTPVIATPVAAAPAIILDNQTSALTVGATDPDGNVLLYTWTASNGTIAGNGPTVSFTPPLVWQPTDIQITVTVSDPIGAFVVSQTVVRVSPSFARNIAVFASVTVSSENVADGQLGVKAIDGVIDGSGGIPGNITREWATLGEGAGAFIRLRWPSLLTVNEVRLYDRVNLTDHIQSGVLDFSDGTSITVGSLPNDGSGLIVPVLGRTVSWVRLTVTSAAGGNTGLAEMEVLGGLGTPCTIPQPFSFAAQTNVYPGAIAVSNPITVRGTNTSTTITILGGEYSIDGGSYTSAPGTVLEGQAVTVRQNAPANSNETRVATLTIGGISADFSLTTGAVTPNPFTFTTQTEVARDNMRNASQSAPQVNVARESTVSSNSIAEGTIDTPTSAAGAVANGQTVLTASTQFTTTTMVTPTVGREVGPFSVTTVAADTTPNSFSFPSRTDVSVGSHVMSTSVQTWGLVTAVPISVSNGQYRIDDGPWTSAPGTVANNQDVQVRHRAASTRNSSKTTTVTIAGVSGTFTSTTVN